MLLMSYQYFHLDDSGILKEKVIANSSWYLITLRTHILFGLIAITAGPFQFIDRIRTQFPAWHRRLGYVYMISVFTSGISGLIIAQFAMGGPISSVGFSVLAVVWLAITYLGLDKILKKQIKAHQKMMYLSYALTFAAITQRTLLLAPLFFEVEFIKVYRLSAWLPWILNLVIANYLYNRNKIKLIRTGH